MFRTWKSRFATAIITVVVVVIGGLSTLAYFVGIEGAYGWEAAGIVMLIITLILLATFLLAAILVVVGKWVDRGE